MQIFIVYVITLDTSSYLVYNHLREVVGFLEKVLSNIPSGLKIGSYFQLINKLVIKLWSPLKTTMPCYCISNNSNLTLARKLQRAGHVKEYHISKEVG